MKSIQNWTEYFKEEKDVFVQNIANGQVSLQFETSPGQTIGFLVPHTRDPFNLTQHVPFDSIKRSADFRKMINRRPPALQLLTEEEYLEHYKNKAKRQGLKSHMDAINEAEERRQALVNKVPKANMPEPKPIHEVVQDGKKFGEHKEVRSLETATEDEVINPRVLHLCQQVNIQIEDKDKMKAGELLAELQNIEEELKLDDFEYVRAHGYWKTVRNWAKAKVNQLAAAEEGDDTAEASPAEA